MAICFMCFIKLVRLVAAIYGTYTNNNNNQHYTDMNNTKFVARQLYLLTPVSETLLTRKKLRIYGWDVMEHNMYYHFCELCSSRGSPQEKMPKV